MRPRRSALNSLWILAPFIFLSPSAAAQTVAVPARVTEAVNSANRVAIKGNTHPLARPQYDRGATADSLPMERMLLVLQRSAEQEAALTALLASQQDKSSPNFHKWLTPDQFGQQFGPADADIRAVTDWLASQGFQVGNISRGRTAIEFSGDAGLVRNAFRTEIHNYFVNGEEHWANSSDPQIPAALAPVIVGLDSLNNFPLKPLHRVVGVFSKSRATGEVKPVTPSFSFSGCNATCNAVGPYDFATIYNVLPLWNAGIDGTGQVIAIAGDSNINLQDVVNFRSLLGLPANNPQVIVNGTNPELQADETEADLDVQWAGAVAKGAAIDLVISATVATSGVILSAQYIVDNNFAPVMSVSFGNCELFLGTAGNQFISQLWQQAAAEGITVVTATGDQGSAACDAGAAVAVNGLAVSGVASTPYNIAVGGTDFNDISNQSTFWNTTNASSTQSSAKGYIPETTWNDSCTNALLSDFGFGTNAEANCNTDLLEKDGFLVVAGGGGGVSSCIASSATTLGACSGGYPKPSWQAGAGVPNDGVRDLPDVSLFSGNGLLDGSFYIICQMDTDPLGQSCSLNSPFADFLGVGGTSAASPAFAGVMAMVNQKTGSRQGLANPTLYTVAAQSGSTCASAASPSGSCVFYDVTSGTNAMPCLKASPNCTTSNSSDSFGVLSGYNAAANYDLATGLGSVNAANLVANWIAVAQSGGGLSSFTLSANKLTIDIPVAGQTGTAIVTVSGTSAFLGSVNLACTVSPLPVVDPPTCSFNPAAVILGGGTTSATATLSIASTGAQSGALARRVLPNPPTGMIEMAVVSLACLLLLLAAPKRRHSPVWLGLLAFVFMGAVAGCGSGNGNTGDRVVPQTPSGDYVVAITATSGTVKETTNVFVTIP